MMPAPTATPVRAPRSTDSKSLLKQRAYSELKQCIQDATFAPGDFLSERQLAAQLGMSKTPIKAALERLESEGFIAVSPQQGIVVRDLSVHEIADQFEIRLALETFVLRSLAGKLTDLQTADVRHNLQQQRQAAKAGELVRSVQLDSEFHLLFGKFLGNQEILHVMLRLREKMHRVVARVMQHNADRLAASYREHRAIAEAVLDGDAERAATALAEHLNYGKRLLLSPRP